MPRFVLLHHECPNDVPRPTHWDFMLEEGPHLRTWILEHLPASWASALAAYKTAEESQIDSTNEVAAEEIQPHRLEYLTLQGPISGGRGSIVQLDAGRCDIVEQSEVVIAARLSGSHLKQSIRIECAQFSHALWRLYVESERASSSTQPHSWRA